MSDHAFSATGNALTRRHFLALAGAVPAALLAPASMTRVFGQTAAPGGPAGKRAKYPIGLELYSVRDEVGRDVPNTLRQVAGMGYEVVEFYAPYYEWSRPRAKEIRSLLDDLGLRCYSTHNHIEAFTPGPGLGKAIELNQILGTRIIVMASAPGTVAGLDS